MKLNQIAFALVATLGVIGAAHADFAGGQSYGGTPGDGLLSLGTYNNTAGAGVDGVSIFGQSHASISQHFTAFGADGNGVYHVAGSQIPGHGDIGVWAFKRAGTGDVWFGNWDKEDGTTTNPDNTSYTTFYTGEKGNVADTVAINANATYSVETLGNFQDDSTALPISTFNVKFGDGAAITSSIGDIAFTNAAIDATGKFTKAGGVSVASTGLTSGNLEGQFYGDTAQAVAGIVTAGTGTVDIRNVSFGGTQTSYTLIP